MDKIAVCTIQGSQMRGGYKKNRPLLSSVFVPLVDS